MSQHAFKSLGDVEVSASTVSYLVEKEDQSIASGAIGQVIPRNCWICEGWVEMQFKVMIPEEYIDHTISSVFIHLDFESYNPMAML